MEFKFDNVENLSKVEKPRNKQRQRWWVKPHNCLQIRHSYGAYEKVFKYFKINDYEEFFKFTRMTMPQFNYLHELLKPKLEKNSHCEFLCPEVRIALVFKYVLTRNN